MLPTDNLLSSLRLTSASSIGFYGFCYYLGTLACLIYEFHLLLVLVKLAVKFKLFDLSFRIGPFTDQVAQKFNERLHDEFIHIFLEQSF